MSVWIAFYKTRNFFLHVTLSYSWHYHIRVDILLRRTSIQYLFFVSHVMWSVSVDIILAATSKKYKCVDIDWKAKGKNDCGLWYIVFCGLGGASLGLGIRNYSPRSFGNSPGSLCHQRKQKHNAVNSPVEFTSLWLNYPQPQMQHCSKWKPRRFRMICCKMLQIQRRYSFFSMDSASRSLLVRS